MEWNKYFYYKGGELYRKISASNNSKLDCPVGYYEPAGYLNVRVNYKQYKVHIIIWELHNGPISEGFFIDHINGVKDDNRIENLRLATRAENMRNRKRYSNSSSKVKGVSWRKDINKYAAKIQVDKVALHLGCFETIEEAAAAYAAAAKLYHGDFAKT